MRVDDLGNLAEQAVLAHYRISVGWMAFHLVPLGDGQGPWLPKDVIGHADFAHIVQKGSPPQVLQFIGRHA
jgi:hypothetical protein